MTQSPVKLLFISRAYRPDAGGMERLSYELHQALLQRPDVHIKSFAYRGRRVFFPFYFIWQLPAILTAAYMVDAIYLGDPVLSPIGWLIKWLCHKPVAVTVHGLDVTYPHPVYQFLLARFFRNFDLYLPISTYASTLVTQQGVIGTIKTIHPGITDSYFDPTITRGALTATLNVDTEKLTVLLTVGRLVPRKGHVWFITNVLPKLPATTQYVIAGDGPTQGAIKAAAEAVGVTSRVHQLGRVADDTLRILYNTVDVFIQPNILSKADPEGLGLVLLEAALCNRPVVAANLEGITDAITSGVNGYLLPAGDGQAWIRFLQQPVHRLPQSRAFTLAQFNWSNQADQFVVALRALSNV